MTLNSQAHTVSCTPQSLHFNNVLYCFSFQDFQCVYVVGTVLSSVDPALAVHLLFVVVSYFKYSNANVILGLTLKVRCEWCSDCGANSKGLGYSKVELKINAEWKNSYKFE